jgi:hypothetical protein
LRGRERVKRIERDKKRGNLSELQGKTVKRIERDKERGNLSELKGKRE